MYENFRTKNKVSKTTVHTGIVVSFDFKRRRREMDSRNHSIYIII